MLVPHHSHFVFLILGTSSAVSALEDLHRCLQQKRDDFVAKLEARALWQRANHCMFHSTSPWAFVGRQHTIGIQENQIDPSFVEIHCNVFLSACRISHEHLR